MNNLQNFAYPVKRGLATNAEFVKGHSIINRMKQEESHLKSFNRGCLEAVSERMEVCAASQSRETARAATGTDFLLFFVSSPFLLFGTKGTKSWL